MNNALSHVTVLDLSRILAGPWAGQVLADLGAEVIKIERPGSGDDTRAWGPPFLRNADGSESADGAYYLCANRNKKSVTVDFTTPDGQALIRELARTSDIVLENFKVGGLKAYGLDYESLKALNPRLIYCSITGFGQTGPYAPRAGTVPLVANPLRLSATPVSYRSAPPILGSHTREVLGERLGLSAADIEALAAKGVI